MNFMIFIFIFSQVIHLTNSQSAAKAKLNGGTIALKKAQIFPAKFTNSSNQMISIKAKTNANTKCLTVALLSAKKVVNTMTTEVSFSICTDADFEVKLPKSSKVIRSKGVRLARGNYVLNLAIVLINRCFAIRVDGTVFGGLSCPAVDHLPLEAINWIKITGQMLLLDDQPLVQQIDHQTFTPNEENSKFSSGIVNAMSDQCNGENMVYSLKMNDSWTIRGRKFNCSFAWLLDRYELSDKNAISEQIEVKGPGHAKFVFLTAAYESNYQSLRMLIAKIKELFGCQQKIIAYDMENVTKNTEWIAELNSVCNLEWRIFDFSQMADVRVRPLLNTYAWRIFLLANVFLEYDTFFWVDPMVNLQSSNWTHILGQIQTGKIGPLQTPTLLWHGMNTATHPGMYEYVPLYTNFDVAVNGNDPSQFEGGLIIVHKSEQMRQLLKWALLCAAESDCIVPFGQTEHCRPNVHAGPLLYTALEPNLTCHRHTQSLLGILRYNMEYQLQINDPSFLPHTNLAHPRWSEIDGLFRVDGQVFNGTGDEWLQRVKCC